MLESTDASENMHSLTEVGLFFYVFFFFGGGSKKTSTTKAKNHKYLADMRSDDTVSWKYLYILDKE